MGQTVKNKVSVAVGCILEGKNMKVTGEDWSVFDDLNDDPTPGEGVIFTPEEIVDILASFLIFEAEDPGRGVTPRIYRSALRLFKAFHINTPSSYRNRPLLEEGGSVRFVRGKQKKRRV